MISIMATWTISCFFLHIIANGCTDFSSGGAEQGLFPSSLCSPGSHEPTGLLVLSKVSSWSRGVLLCNCCLLVRQFSNGTICQSLKKSPPTRVDSDLWLLVICVSVRSAFIATFLIIWKGNGGCTAADSEG